MTPRANRWATTASIVALVAAIVFAGYRESSSESAATIGATTDNHPGPAGQLGSEALASPITAQAPAPTPYPPNHRSSCPPGPPAAPPTWRPAPRCCASCCSSRPTRSTTRTRSP